MRVSQWVNYEEVAGAAEAIAAQNEIPTTTRLRDYLGRGSNTTLQKYLNQWKNNQPQATQEPPDPVNQAVKRVWEQMNSASQEEIQRIKEVSNETIKTLEDKLSELDAERAQFAQNWSDAKQELQGAHEEITRLQTTLAKLQEEQGLSNVREALLEQQLRRLASSHDENVTQLKAAHEQALLALTIQAKQERESGLTKFNELTGLHESQRHEWIVEKENLKIALATTEQKLTFVEKSLKAVQNLNQQSENALHLKQEDFQRLQQRFEKYVNHADKKDTVIADIQMELKNLAGIFKEESLQTNLHIQACFEQLIIKPETAKEEI